MEPLDEVGRALGRLAGLLGASRERQADRSLGDRLERLRDEPRALADVERPKSAE
jgi:hypothetical protein